MSDKDALLPCPFCGAKPYFCPDDSYGAASIYCPTPDCETGFACEKESPEKVIKQWNTRITAALAEKDDGWIKCSERLPTEKDATNKSQVLAMWTDESVMAIRWNRIPEYAGITHWRPLPPLPKGE